MQYFLCVYEWRLSRGRAEWATPEAYHLLTLSYAGQIHQIDHDLDHLDAIIPVWYDVGDLYSIDPTLQQELDHTDEEYVVPCNIYRSTDSRSWSVRCMKGDQESERDDPIVRQESWLYCKSPTSY